MQRAVTPADEQIGRLLVEGAFLDKAQLNEALQEMRKTGKRLREVLLSKGLVSQETFNTLLSVHLRIPVVDLQNIKVDPAAIKLVPEDVARQHSILPIAIEGDSLKVAMDDPQNVEALNTLATITGKRIKPVLPLRGGIQEMFSAHYKLTPKIKEELGDLMTAAAAGPTPEAQRAAAGQAAAADVAAQTPVVRALDLIINQAIKERASDIHIEPLEEIVRIRYRIDGVLQEATTLPKGVHSALVSRIKVMSGMDIAERRRPQDGQFSRTLNNRDIDFRVASIETDQGEVMSLRVLDKTTSLVPLDKLGFLPVAKEQFEQMLKSPFGMIMVNGPTGSGKTTTLYSALSQIDSEHQNIMTIEDPVEYHFKGVNQIQVNAQAGITFAAGLRAIMRHDPNIILVGEIRDRETAQTAVNAALTGHLVLTTIHANDSASAIVRLVDLGVEPFLATSAIIASIAQRLVRKVCPYCKTMTRVSPSEVAAYQHEMGEARNEFYVGRGCNMCSRSGSLGRIGVYEVLTMTDPIRNLINQRSTAGEIHAEATRGGMVTMQRDGMTKARDGITTPSEVIRRVFSIA